MRLPARVGVGCASAGLLLALVSGLAGGRPARTVAWRALAAAAACGGIGAVLGRLLEPAAEPRAEQPAVEPEAARG